MSDHADGFTPEQIAENIWATLQGLTPEERSRVVARLDELATAEGFSMCAGEPAP